MSDYQPEDYVNYRLHRAKEIIAEVEKINTESTPKSTYHR